MTPRIARPCPMGGFVIKEITRYRRFRITCDVCGRPEIVSVDLGESSDPDAGTTRTAYAIIAGEGWDVRGLTDICSHHDVGSKDD